MGIRHVSGKLIQLTLADLNKRGVDVQGIALNLLSVEVAKSLIRLGIREDMGNNRSHSGLVEMIESTVGHADAQPWCMNFQQTITGIVEALRKVKSNLPVSQGCHDTENQARQRGVKVLPADEKDLHPGDISIWHPLPGVANGHTGRNMGAAEAAGMILKPGEWLSAEGNTQYHLGGQGADYQVRNRVGYPGKKLACFIREEFVPA